MYVLGRGGGGGGGLVGGEGVKTASSVVLASSNHCNVILDTKNASCVQFKRGRKGERTEYSLTIKRDRAPLTVGMQDPKDFALSLLSQLLMITPENGRWALKPGTFRIF